MQTEQRLQRYFVNSLHEMAQHQVDDEWRQFYAKSFSTQRNSDTSDLKYELSSHLEDASEFVSDNVAIFPSLEHSIEKIVLRRLVIADKAAYDFLERVYSVSLQPRFVTYIADITTGTDLENIISKFSDDDITTFIAIGGGRTLDYAKYISWVTGAKLLAIPSSLATHVYASPKIHALNPIKELGFTQTIDGNPAHLSLIDVTMLSCLFREKKRLVFSGFGDIMAFINSQKDWKVSAKNGNERYSLFVDKSIDVIINKLTEIDVTSPLDGWISDYIFIQCLLCNITDWVGSAPASGAEHLFAKTVEDQSSAEVLHGEVVALGVLIFAFIRGEDVALASSLMKKFEISNKLEHLGLTFEGVVEALAECGMEGERKRRFTVLQDIDNSATFFRDVLASMLSANLLTE